MNCVSCVAQWILCIAYWELELADGSLSVYRGELLYLSRSAVAESSLCYLGGDAMSPGRDLSGELLAGLALALALEPHACGFTYMFISAVNL